MSDHSTLQAALESLNKNVFYYSQSALQPAYSAIKNACSERDFEEAHESEINSSLDMFEVMDAFYEGFFGLKMYSPELVVVSEGEDDSGIEEDSFFCYQVGSLNVNRFESDFKQAFNNLFSEPSFTVAHDEVIRLISYEDENLLTDIIRSDDLDDVCNELNRLMTIVVWKISEKHFPDKLIEAQAS